MLLPLALALALCASLPHSFARPGAPNIVVIVADDLGVDLVDAYGESIDAPCTPNLDELAARGMLFRNAWSNPVCSPTRAALLTGRYGFRTGIGAVIENSDVGLSLAETLIPEVLRRYSSACIGKWHLSGVFGATHPNDSGFDHFAGLVPGEVSNYWLWPRTVDGITAQETSYCTSKMTDDAIAWLQSAPTPWITFVTYNSPHAPFHAPPTALHPTAPCAHSYCTHLPATPTPADLGRAMVESLDTEIGRLLATVDQIDPDAYVFFLGDNGSPVLLSKPPFTPAHAKGTLYEGGVNVPLIVRGPRVARGECAALVSVTDLFATIVQLAGARASATDSVSLVPYFSQPSLSLRSTVYTERFSPNHSAAPFAVHERAIRGARFKLIRRTGQPDEFFDLVSDPFELHNLYPNLNVAEQDAYNAFNAELNAMGVG